MKITMGSKFNENWLREADEEGVELNQSTADVADELQDQSMEAGIALTDKEAEIGAETAKEVGEKIGSDTVVVVPTKNAPLEIKNELTKILDRALATNLYFKKNNISEVANVLVCGLPGSSKTATIYNWGKGKVNISYLNSKNNDLDAYINGYPTLDPDNPGTVTQAVSTNLDDLDRRNSVLFLDELNRQTNAGIRGSLLSLINEHYIVGKGKNKIRHFDNFLFTIAAINPGGTQEDLGAVKLNDAEKSRFLFNVMDFDSDKKTTSQFFRQKYLPMAKRLAKMKDLDKEDIWDEKDWSAGEEIDYDTVNKQYLDMSQQARIEAFLRIVDLGDFIVNDKDFEYDTKNDIDVLNMQDKVLLNQRALTAGVAAAQGDVDKFVDWVQHYSNFLQRDIDMLIEICERYPNPTWAELKANYPDEVDAFEDELDTEEDAKTAETNKAEIEDDEDFSDEGIEDDEEAFNSGKPIAGNTTMHPSDVGTLITNRLAQF